MTQTFINHNLLIIFIIEKQFEIFWTHDKSWTWTWIEIINNNIIILPLSLASKVKIMNDWILKFEYFKKLDLSFRTLNFPQLTLASS